MWRIIVIDGEHLRFLGRRMSAADSIFWAHRAQQLGFRTIIVQA